MARSRDFNDVFTKINRAMQRGKSPDIYELFDRLGTMLDDLTADIQSVKSGAQTKSSGGGGGNAEFNAVGATTASRTAVMPRAIANGTALRKPLALKVATNAITTASQEQIAGVDDSRSGYPLQTGRDANGEIIINAAVNWQNGALRLATAADASLPCSGIVESVGDFTNQFNFRDGGICYALVILPIQTYSNRLFLSVTPGFLTTDPAELGKLYNQEVGRFRKFLNPAAWQAQDGAAVAEISFQYSPPY